MRLPYDFDIICNCEMLLSDYIERFWQVESRARLVIEQLVDNRYTSVLKGRGMDFARQLGLRRPRCLR